MEPTADHESVSKKQRRLLSQQKRVPYKLKELKAAKHVVRAMDKTTAHTQRRSRPDDDMHPGDVRHTESALDLYDWGDRVDLSSVRSGPHQQRLARREKMLNKSVHQMVTSEMLLQEESGFLEGDLGEDTADICQSDIVAAVDITSATKRFDLQLRQYGPYTADYTRSGRHLVIGGSTGHLAAFDAATKQLMCEVAVTESVHSVRWLHNENMFAAAQKEWVYVYDSAGTEMHCLKKLHRVTRMEFLPYHFLLATCGDRGWLSWLDVSTGSMVRQSNVRMGQLGVMCQNPSNAVLCLGHTRGVVSMWTPNVPEPVVKLLCHAHPVRAVSVHNAGVYMATASADSTVKVWDLRTYKCLQSMRLGAGASHIRWSQQNLLAAAVGNMVEVYRDVVHTQSRRPYMRHRLSGTVSSIQFCPYEDVLGIGHRAGFSSILIPGAGEPNFDAYEGNPFQTRKQRREAEVKQLLEKIQPELITLESNALGQVDVPTLQEKLSAKQKLLYVKTPKIDFKPRKKTKGRSKSTKKLQRKKGVIEHEQRVYLKEAKKASKSYRESTSKADQSELDAQSAAPAAVLDRFKPKPV